jgi:hypothetical protein
MKQISKTENRKEEIAEQKNMKGDRGNPFGPEEETAHGPLKLSSESVHLSLSLTR